jgi:hypothetical protein
MFSFANTKVILDWYHLRKKMEEQLSLICNNRHYRNEVLQKIIPVLWRGDVDGAIAILSSLEKSMVKNNDSLVYLTGYLERVRSSIPNYIMRDALGLRNSSNRGEKSNDIVVASRQKHNGMSWSDTDSTSLASISAIIYNKELNKWTENGTLSFCLINRTTPKRGKRYRKRTDISYSNSQSIKKSSRSIA